jgi:hypothetical protein
MPFGSMVVFMVKWAIAAIPAVAILATVVFSVVALLGVGAGVIQGIAPGASGWPVRGASQAEKRPSSETSGNDPKHLYGTSAVYLDSQTKTVHQPGCTSVASIKDPVVGTWNEGFGRGYSSHQCVIAR